MLGQESEKLCHTHPDHAEQIQAKQQEIMQNWNELIGKRNFQFKISPLDGAHVEQKTIFLAKFLEVLTIA